MSTTGYNLYAFKPDQMDATALAQSVSRAFERLESLRESSPGSVLRTPLLRSRAWLEPLLRCPVYIKLESEQVTGSFKVRGALNAISVAKEKDGGTMPIVVTASTGNHALATAHALDIIGAGEKGRIFLPRGASQAKVSVLGTHSSVELQFVDGDDCVEAEVAAGKFAKSDPRAMYSEYRKCLDGGWGRYFGKEDLLTERASFVQSWGV